MATLITILGGKGGSGKSTTAFLLGWYLTHCTPFEAQWVDLDVRTSTLSEVFESRTMEGLVVPELAFSAIRDAASARAQDVAQAFDEFLNQHINDDVVFVVDTPPDFLFPATQKALSLSKIILIPMLLSVPVATETCRMTIALVKRFAEEIDRQERYLMLLPIGQSQGAVISANEKTALELIDPIDNRVQRLVPIPRSETIPYAMMLGVYPTEWTSTRYRAEKGNQLHQAIRNSFYPIEEALANIKR